MNSLLNSTRMLTQRHVSRKCARSDLAQGGYRCCVGFFISNSGVNVFTECAILLNKLQLRRLFNQFAVLDAEC